MRITTIPILSVLLALGMYAIFVFVTWEPNPANWVMPLRFLFAAWWVAGTFAIASSTVTRRASNGR